MKTNLTAAQRDAWAEALESGKYMQCRNALYSENAFCCLDVLHVAALRKEIPKLSYIGQTYNDFDALFGASTHTKEFVNANDLEFKSFPEIAQMVRALEVVDV